MAEKMVTLTIDNRTVTVPDGTLIVNAAKTVGIDIPVFCFHPKLEAVGMCRMCLVDIGRPMVDRATREIVREADGRPKIQFGPKLETSCTTPVAQDMVVVTNSEKVLVARREVVEFLLTSHPLDCPVCDKGGECPLQNLTMAHGAGQSRFDFAEKHHAQKHVALGDLIFLDRERCIQCGRCVRFQQEIADDAVLGFYRRGRDMQITTLSEPGFDSIFSGNTTDICPVGALTTADFRFGARSWEMKAVASLCNHCAVGCNITVNVRREASSGGRLVVKRVMPRQNEEVNDIWICDKGRFGYHFVEQDRLREPLARKNGELKPVSWDEAIKLAAEKIKAAGNGLVALVGGRLANEDLFNLSQLADAQGGKKLLYSFMGGGDLVGQIGLSQGSNIAAMGKDTAILVVGCDLHEEAPLWWLQLRQAAKRGAALIVANPRPTRLDKDASYTLRYAYGEEAALVAGFFPPPEDGPLSAAARAFAGAANAVIFYGSEGMSLTGSTNLARACSELLVQTRHFGKPNNGLVAVWPHANTQGAWDIGFRPLSDLAGELEQAKVTYVVGVDAADEPQLAKSLRAGKFVIVQDLTLTPTAQAADLVLPAAAFTEREGSYTSGERRVQRFYPAASPLPGARPDFTISAQIAKALGVALEEYSPAQVFLGMAAQVPGYAGLTYQKLAEVHEQWPPLGRKDQYFGGTSYENRQGLGVQLSPLTQGGKPVNLPRLPKPVPADALLGEEELLVVPVTYLYDQGTTLRPSQATLLEKRCQKAALRMSSKTAEKFALRDGKKARLTLSGLSVDLEIVLDELVPFGAALLPRSVGVPALVPMATRVQPV